MLGLEIDGEQTFMNYNLEQAARSPIIYAIDHANYLGRSFGLSSLSLMQNNTGCSEAFTNNQTKTLPSEEQW